MPNLALAAISFTATGDNTLVTGVAGKIISVYKIYLAASAATNLTFKDGASTTQSGAIPMAVNGQLVFVYDTTPWFFASPGNNFVLNQSGTAQVSGTIYYIQR
jgi:hypothetical protein